MTVAFDEFMRQYKMTGSEKADGYSRDAFIGLDEHEKLTAFNLLAREGPYSVGWLFFLDVEKALIHAKTEEQGMRGDSYAYVLQEYLVRYSGDLIYQKHMIEDYPSYKDRSKSMVLDSLDRTPANTSTVALFKQVILTEVDSSAVASAAYHLLSALKIPRATEAENEYFHRLIRELRSENIQDKLVTLNQIAKYEASLPVVE